VLKYRPVSRFSKSERLGDGGNDQGGIAHGSQRNEEDAISKACSYLGCYLQRQAGLADTAWAGERE
jgi:hypothetical protein